MTEKQAPAPWRYDYEPGYCGELIAANGVVVATFTDEPSPEHAALIVAAPTLLDELRSTANFLESACLVIGDPEARAMALEQVKSARSAILRATGKE